MGDFGELAELDVALYRAILVKPNSALLDLVEALGSSPDELAKGAARLTTMGLLRAGEGDTLIAVSPMLAEATVLGAEDLELGARRAAVEQRRGPVPPPRPPPEAAPTPGRP